jgi:urea transport system permease protein
MKRVLSALAILAATIFLSAGPSWAADDYSRALNDLASKSRSRISAAVETLQAIGNPDSLAALEALLDGRIRRDGDRAVIEPESGEPYYAADKTPFTGDLDSLKKPRINNKVRRDLKPVIAAFQLASPDREKRLLAASQLADRANPEAEDAIRAALAKEKDADVRGALQVALALTTLHSPDKARRLKAIEAIGDSGNQLLMSRLKPFTEKDADGKYVEKDQDVLKAALDATASLERKMIMVRAGRDLFYGISLGSVLLLAALGLAITFGLMGVINMAHGEMLMLGAYSTYMVQEFFLKYLPGMTEGYLFVALPLAFMIPCGVGMLLERTIIRYLYGRPLETLLATWGISLGLIQTVRLIFGAQNVEVRNPDWLSGGFQLAEGLVITYNRLAIIIFVVLVVGLVWFLLNKTPLGLQVRAVTQNRSTASAMGIFASRIDMWTFGLGSGIAGLGGLALTQVGNVGPELGQSYIVDSFLVVVLGGVGKLAGTVAGALSLGVVNKILEPFTGAVLGKIFMLALVILFIQKRPQGIFALKGRMMED